MQASFVSVQIQMKLLLEPHSYLLPRLLSSSYRHRTAKQICLWLLPACIHVFLLFCYLKGNHLGRVTYLHLPCAMEEALMHQKVATVGQQANSNWQVCNNSLTFLLQPCVSLLFSKYCCLLSTKLYTKTMHFESPGTQPLVCNFL